MNSTDVLTLIALGLFLLFGFYLFFRSILKLLPETVWIAAIPTSRVRSVALGLAEVTGIAKPDKPIRSPATGMDCCLTEYKVQELKVYYTRSGRQTSWETIDSGFLYVPFYIQDDEGNKILVDPTGAELYLPSETYYPNTGIPTNEPGAVRYLEWAIYPGNPLYVLGEVKEKPPSAGLEGEVDERLAILRGDQEKMAKCDENKDGQIDEMEWDKAVREIETEVNEEEEKAGNALVIAKPVMQRPFLISTRSEKNILSRLRWKGYSAFFFGLLFIFFNLAGILGFFFSQPDFGKKYCQVVKLIANTVLNNTRED